MPFTPPGEYPYVNDTSPGAGDGDIVYAEIVNVIMAYLQDVLPIDISEAAVEDVYHASILGRDAPESHPADAIVVDASGFNGNLTTGDDDVQKVAQKVDDLSLGGTYTDENARDAIATALTAGSGITITPNDGADTITIDATGSYTDEQARDAIATALTAGTGITVTPNDGADTITVATTITQYTDEMARDALGTALTEGSGIDITVSDGSDTITIASTFDPASVYTITANTQTGDYTLVLSDAGKVIEMNSASATVLTVPPNASVAFPIGTVIEVYRMGAGAVTVDNGSGVTIRNEGSLAAQYATASLRKRATNEWVLSGELT